MLLATRCPHCDTVFRLQPAQLEQHGGLVRCGHCHNVFDASAALVDSDAPDDVARQESARDEGEHAEHAPDTPQNAAGKDTPRAAQTDFSGNQWNAWAPSLGERATLLQRRPLTDTASAAENHPSSVGSDAGAHASAAEYPHAAASHHDAREPRFTNGAAPSASAPTDGPPPFSVTREPRAPQRNRTIRDFIGGLVGGTLALAALALLAWWQRDTLMIDWPVTQRWFAQACSPIGCTITPPHAIDGLRLDASSLRELDGPRALELTAPLANRYGIALAYPSIELTLFDQTNRMTVRRVLAPRDYLPGGTPIEAGLPAGAKQTISVRIETDGTPASNFRVRIFYP